MRLRAARLWAHCDERIAVVAVADRVEDPAAFIVVSRELMPDAMRRKLGMDGVYIEINSDKCAAFRAASGYSFDGRELRIIVAQSVLPRLQLTGDLWIELAEPTMDTEQLRAALAAIFATEPK